MGLLCQQLEAHVAQQALFHEEELGLGVIVGLANEDVTRRLLQLLIQGGGRDGIQPLCPGQGC